MCPITSASVNCILTSQSSVIIEELKFRAFQTESCAVAYYYCEYKRIETQTLQNILGSLISQICAYSEGAFEDLQQVYTQFNEATHPVLPTILELKKLLIRSTSHVDYVAIIIDGLDECLSTDERSNLLNFISSINTPQYGNNKIICTSRDLVDIREHLFDFDRISIAARSNDLELYVTAGIEQRLEAKSLRLRDKLLKEYIVNTIVSKANGM